VVFVGHPFLGKVVRTLITSDINRNSVSSHRKPSRNLRRARTICSDFWKKERAYVPLAIYELSAADVTMGFEKDIHWYKNVN
jgi:hypothetical protein